MQTSGDLWLKLSTGQKFLCSSSSSKIEVSGEVVFTTAMVGYTEALTDPSYYGQILVFSYPHIGNYGVPNMDNKSRIPCTGFESHSPKIAAVILATECQNYSHWNAQVELNVWLEKYNVPVFHGIDTRHLISLLRTTTTVFGQTGTVDASMTQPYFDPSAQNILDKVSIQEPMTFGNGNKKIAVIDCGMKWNIIRKIISLGFEVNVYPWDWDFATVDCDAWIISNGPGDPKKTGNLVTQIKNLLKQTRPILGICLGHQLLALAAGGDTKRMNYGHRGLNHPIYDITTDKGFITSQNHGFEVVQIPQDWNLWFVNANDKSVEGIRHNSLPFWGVQFHPEASPGPREGEEILKKFLELV